MRIRPATAVLVTVDGALIGFLILIAIVAEGTPGVFMSTSFSLLAAWFVFETQRPLHIGAPGISRGSLSFKGRRLVKWTDVEDARIIVRGRTIALALYGDEHTIYILDDTTQLRNNEGYERLREVQSSVRANKRGSRLVMATHAASVNGDTESFTLRASRASRITVWLTFPLAWVVAWSTFPDFNLSDLHAPSLLVVWVLALAYIWLLAGPALVITETHVGRRIWGRTRWFTWEHVRDVRMSGRAIVLLLDDDRALMCVGAFPPKQVPLAFAAARSHLRSA